MTIEAKVIADSISEHGHRITTMQLRYPKFIHGECKTHRVLNAGNEGAVELFQEVGLMDDDNLSRNASSSRAVPTSKLIKEARSDTLRAAPVYWGKNQSGMQAAEELSGEHLAEAQAAWRAAAHCAADYAEWMEAAGAHKQIVNRILEPFTHINTVVTATEWGNFFGLRLHKDTQPEMRALAVAMWNAMSASKPTALSAGQWHLPYIKDGERGLGRSTAIKISVARCARVSYTSFETGKQSTIEEDLKLYDRLVGSQPMHASPAEHQATPGNRGISEHLWGNLKGWIQYRKTLPDENCAPMPNLA